MNPLNMILGNINNNNSLNIIKNIIGNGNPKQMIMKYINNTSPQMQKIINLANSGNTEELKNIARDIFKENGRDFDKEFEEFISNIR